MMRFINVMKHTAGERKCSFVIYCKAGKQIQIVRQNFNQKQASPPPTTSIEGLLVVSGPSVTGFKCDTWNVGKNKQWCGRSNLKVTSFTYWRILYGPMYLVLRFLHPCVHLMSVVDQCCYQSKPVVYCGWVCGISISGEQKRLVT